MPTRPHHDIHFEGIDAPNTTPVPDVYFDELFPHLEKRQLKVLLYITRRTFGFKKDGDTISLTQLCRGIRRHDGTMQDYGTGLKRDYVIAAVRELEAMGVIVAERSKASAGDDATTYYAPRFRPQVSMSSLLNEKAEHGRAYRFPGIDAPNTTPVPDIYFDLLLPELHKAEWLVLLYIVRHTLGYKKLHDAISLDQFNAGIVTREGRRLDHGTGLDRSSIVRAVSGLVMRNIVHREHVKGPDKGDRVSIYGLAMRDHAQSDMIQRLGLAAGTNGTLSDTSLSQGDAQEDYPGIVQKDHGGGAQWDYQGSAQKDYHIAADSTGTAMGVAQKDHQGDAQRDHGSRRSGPTPVAEEGLPVVLEPDPQETAIQERPVQETAIQDVTLSKFSKDPASKKISQKSSSPREHGATLYNAMIFTAIEDWSIEFHDSEHVKSNRTRTLNLWHKSGLDDECFMNHMYEARRRTKRAVVSKAAMDGSGTAFGTTARNKMPYFFSTLEDLLVDDPASQVE